MLDWWDDPVPTGGCLPADGVLGIALRAARDRKALSQKDLAKQSGVSQSVISRLESGQRASWATFCRLLHAMDLEPVVTTRRRRTDIELEVDRLATISPARRLDEHGLFLDWLPEVLPATGWAVDGDAALLAHGVPVAPTGFQIMLAEAVAEHERVQGHRMQRDSQLRFRVVPQLPAHLLVEAGGRSIPVLSLDQIDLGEPHTQERTEREAAIDAYLRSARPS